MAATHFLSVRAKNPDHLYSLINRPPIRRPPTRYLPIRRLIVHSVHTLHTVHTVHTVQAGHTVPAVPTVHTVTIVRTVGILESELAYFHTFKLSHFHTLIL